MRRTWLTATIVFLASCGGGGSGGAPAPVAPLPIAAPTGLSYSSPVILVVGKVAPTLMPSVTGTVTSYSIAPPLPAGLVLDAISGAISGTPTSPAAMATHKIDAINSGGSTSATLAITVNDVPPVIAYGGGDFKMTTDVPVTIAPTNSGGAASAWTISPALPQGLVFGTADGTINGAPTVESANTTYVVTAHNSGGTSTRNIAIAVESGLLIDLGHAATIAVLVETATRVLSADAGDTRHWALWNPQTTAKIAGGDFPRCHWKEFDCGGPLADLRGSTLGIRTADGIELRSASDGRLLAMIPTAPAWAWTRYSWWGLAADGSYAAMTDESGVTVWSTAGAVLFSKPGDYTNAAPFAAAGELRIAAGPAGANLVEKISVPGGTITHTPPFSTVSETFHSWFVDGERFFTIIGNTIRVYSKDAAQQDIKALPSTALLAGKDGWFWVADNLSTHRLTIYAVGASGTPAADYGFQNFVRLRPSGSTIGVLEDESNNVHVIDLSDPSLPLKGYHMTTLGLRAYGAVSSTQWVVGNEHGVILDGRDPEHSPKMFNLGEAWSVAGGDHRVAVATAAGKILYFNSDTKTEEGSIDFPASDLAISDDGTVLVARASSEYAQYYPSLPTKVFSLPSGVELSTRPRFLDVALSASGTVLGAVTRVAPTLERRVETLAGASIWVEARPYNNNQDSARDLHIALSPNGSRIAAPDRRPESGVHTDLILNGSLYSTAAGWPAGWIDDNRLLVNRYSGISSSANVAFVGADIVDTAGNRLASPPLPEIRDPQPAGVDLIYSQRQNTIYSVITGQTVWTTPSPAHGLGTGAVSGNHVVFASGSTVRAEAY